jgi:hypothetical protein
MLVRLLDIKLLEDHILAAPMVVPLDIGNHLLVLHGGACPEDGVLLPPRWREHWLLHNLWEAAIILIVVVNCLHEAETVVPCPAPY